MPYCNNCGRELERDDKFCPQCGNPNPNYEGNEIEVETPIDGYQTIKKDSSLYGRVTLEDLPQDYIIDDRYEVKEKLGQGGFGAVYRVFDKKMEIEKALKVIPQAITNDEEAMLDLQRESRTMISLSHQNIVRVYDFHDEGSIKYIDMEYVDGKTLTRMKIEQPNKQMPEDEVKKYAIKIAEGLAYAHSKNVIHKDIKPQNVMITKDNQVKIMDFGIAETVRTSMSRIRNSSSSGTLVYMSPEQLTGKNVGKESDIYSFGAMLYELLSGHPPFYRGDINYQILHEKSEPLAFVSDRLNDLVMKCLEKEYRNRFFDFEEVEEYLSSKVVEIDKSAGNGSRWSQTKELKKIYEEYSNKANQEFDQEKKNPKAELGNFDNKNRIIEKKKDDKKSFKKNESKNSAIYKDKTVKSYFKHVILHLIFLILGWSLITFITFAIFHTFSFVVVIFFQGLLFGGLTSITFNIAIHNLSKKHITKIILIWTFCFFLIYLIKVPYIGYFLFPTIPAFFTGLVIKKANSLISLKNIVFALTLWFIFRLLLISRTFWIYNSYQLLLSLIFVYFGILLHIIYRSRKKKSSRIK